MAVNRGRVVSALQYNPFLFSKAFRFYFFFMKPCKDGHKLGQIHFHNFHLTV